MATKKHTFSDSHIQLDVTEPTNVTGNNAYISQKFWTDGSTPSDNMSADGVGNSNKYSWYGNFISCMELDWGNAKGSGDAFTNMTETDINNLLFGKGIKTSDELLQVLCWLFKNRSQTSDPFVTISNTTITRLKNNTLSSISWTGGSVTPDSVVSGAEITFNKGTVTATYGNNNGTAIITTSNISGVLTITSSNTSVVTINNVVKNGQTTITGIKAGTAIITVKDDENVVNEFNVTVENGSNTIDITDSTTFEDSKGSSIDGTTIIAPTVTSDETITIKATYGGKTALNKISYTITPATIVSYYWYAGQTQPTSMDETPVVDDTNFTNNKWHTLGDATTIAKTITGGTSGLDWYVVVPTTVGLKATASDLSTPNPTWDNIETITINSISYTIWRTNSTGGRQAVYMAK